MRLWYDEWYAHLYNYNVMYIIKLYMYMFSVVQNIPKTNESAHNNWMEIWSCKVDVSLVFLNPICICPHRLLCDHVVSSWRQIRRKYNHAKLIILNLIANHDCSLHAPVRLDCSVIGSISSIIISQPFIQTERFYNLSVQYRIGYWLTKFYSHEHKLMDISSAQSYKVVNAVGQ